MKLYENIKARRKELGMTQEELATKLGYASRSTINKIELGQRDIPQAKIEAFAAALKTDATTLMGYDGIIDKPYEAYLSDEIIEYAYELRDNPQLKEAYELIRTLSPNDLDLLLNMASRLRK